MEITQKKSIFLTWVFALGSFWNAQAHEAVLMDTRTATSDVGWTMSQGSEWQEASSNHRDGSERRMLMVCKIHKAKQNNWVRSPYISVESAERVYVEFEFTIRSCEDVENVATCKETFNLYYYETDRDEATTTFPPWREGAYVKVDTIAADKRFKPGSSETNFETRDIGPLTKRGIYIALQDTGACMALMHVRVYYKYCSPTAQNLAQFRRTNSGPERTSLVEAQGICVDHAFIEHDTVTTLHCNSEGEWAVPKGQCVCGAGFYPNTYRTSCGACGRGFYKASVGNRPCQRCPAYSHSRAYGATVCGCMFGYYRSPLDDPNSPCTKPPSKPTRLRAAVNVSMVTLTWDRPLNDGGRDDLMYRVECSRCQSRFTACASCSNNLKYLPTQTNLQQMEVKVHHISSFAYYKFKVFAENAVSDVASKDNGDRNYALVTIETNRAAPSRVEKLKISQITETSFLVSWGVPIRGWRRVKFYEVKVSDFPNQEVVRVNKTNRRSLLVRGVKGGTGYSVQVRASTEAAFGAFSLPVSIQTMEARTTPPSSMVNEESLPTYQIVIAVIVAAFFVIFLIAVIAFLKRRSRKQNHKVKLGFDKYPVLTTTLLTTGAYPSVQKTYVDPTTYEDPHRAVLDFTKEIEASCVTIEQVIGGGEFGEVCRGCVKLPSSKEEQDVAIKTLKLGISAQHKLDFLREASIMGQFDHPNVIQLKGVVTRSRPLMIITEYMENGSLDGFLRKHDNEFTVIQLVGMLRHIATGMKYLSDMGYVHRDLAARNILVNAQLVCKVSDFGMSRVLEDDSYGACTRRAEKIPIRWTAPEAIHGEFTSASDVWSYGIVMWEVMSYGERPYWGMSNLDVIKAVSTGHRLPAPMDCPQVQHQLMIECWKKNRNDRPEFAAILTSLDVMLQDPSRFAVIAGQQKASNGRLITGGSLARLFRQDESGDRTLEESLLPSRSSVTLPVNIFSRNSSDLSALGDWLETIGLGGYEDNFIRNGCSSIKQILELQHSDFPKLGFVDINHQNVLLNAIYSLRCKSMSCNGGRTSPPQYGDQQVTGIPV